MRGGEGAGSLGRGQWRRRGYRGGSEEAWTRRNRHAQRERPTPGPPAVGGLSTLGAVGGGGDGATTAQSLALFTPPPPRPPRLPPSPHVPILPCPHRPPPAHTLPPALPPLPPHHVPAASPRPSRSQGLSRKSLPCSALGGGTALCRTSLVASW